MSSGGSRRRRRRTRCSTTRCSALRQALGRNGRLETQGSVLADVRPGELDVDRFEELLAGAAPSSSPIPTRPRRCSEALGLWRGPPLSDLAYEQLLRRRSRDWRSGARGVRDALEAELALGRHADLVSELEAAVAEQPLREHLRAQLMLALYRCGRQADALEAYRSARRTLVEEVGVEPGAELRALQDAILAQDPALIRRARSCQRRSRGAPRCWRAGIGSSPR